ncbi:unnamed protein product [Protopolystoma xenopodis]|uniref:Uncharacterized protein n=1 Tax=Protopolystoma xenopodis TaxID=117903 RepID=A0A448XE57_9PLAT|nr:unnamed protein product [Protopolystoma xenopodis]
MLIERTSAVLYEEMSIYAVKRSSVVQLNTDAIGSVHSAASKKAFIVGRYCDTDLMSTVDCMEARQKEGPIFRLQAHARAGQDRSCCCEVKQLLVPGIH